MENSTTTTTTSSEELRSYCNINNMELGYLEEHDDDDDEVELPGFRFHPTDEELVSFYLRRKIENKPISIELIKQIDIYKYDPWDLPKSSSTGEKEGYFYCKRGRKYRNSIRPNRVTGSGFWKATGIDKPVYDNNNDSIIGLKKTLVYYRGSAGKGTKTEWMMHEFRHPPTTTATANNKTHINNNINIPQEAEIWTLCRIFKRNASHRKCAPADHWRHFGGNKRHSSQDQKSNNSTVTTVDQSSAITTDNDKPQTYINFGGTHSDNNNDTFFQQEHKPLINNNNNRINYYYNHHHQVRANDYQLGQNNNCVIPQLTSVPPPPPPPSSISSSSSSSSALSFWNNIHNQVATNNNSSNDLFAFENSSWDELGSIVQFPLSRLRPASIEIQPLCLQE